MPDATITSTASTFGTISGTFAADQSTITGTITGVVSGTLTGSVGVPGPQGPAGPGSTWGGIAGVLSAQTDLWTELGTKYLASNPAGYQTAAQVSTALTPYLLSSTAASTYYPLTGNPSAFLQAAALAPYLTSATASATYQTLAGMSSYLTTSAAAAGYYPLSGNPSGFLTAASLSGYATESWVTGQGYITSAALSPYLLSSTAASTYQTQSAMSAYLAKADNLASVASTSAARSNLGLGSLDTPTFAGITAQGSGSNVANLTPTSLSLNHATSGSFTIQPSVGITFPNGSVQTTAFTGIPSAYISSVSSPLSVTGGNLSIDLSAYLLSSTAASTYAVTARGLPTGGAVGQVLTKNSGSNYDVSFQTFVPGDRYLTSSTTSLTIGNGTKSLTVGTGLSYTPTQNVTISFDSSNHMHGEVLTYNSVTGAMTVDVNHHTGSGTYSAWVINVGGVTPQTSVAWGDITGTLGSQTDLATALSAKLETSTAAATYQTISGMSSYLTTSAAAATYISKSGGTINTNAVITFPVGTSSTTNAVSNQGILIRNASNVPVARFYDNEVLIPSVGITFSDATTQTTAGISSASVAATYQTIAGMSSYAPKASPALTGNVTITSDSTGAALFIEQAGTGNILTLHDQASDTSFVAIDQNGKVNTIASTTTNAGFNVPHATAAPSSPVNGDIWTTTAGLFYQINGATVSPATLAGGTYTGPIITAASTTTAAGLRIPVGTAPTTPVAGDVWSSSGANGTLNFRSGGGTTQAVAALGLNQTFTGNNTFSGATLNFGNATTATTIGLGNGATATATTKTLNLGTGGTAGSTTTINVGTTGGGSATANVNALLISRASTATEAGLRILPGTAPSAPVNGDVWTDATGFYARINGATQNLVPPALATLSEARQFTNDTKVMSPRDVLWSMLSQDFIDIDGPSMTVTNTGTITSVQVGQLSRNIRPGNAGACSSRIRTFGVSQVDQTWTATSRAQPASFLNFSLRSIHSGRSTTSGVTDANYTCAVYYGKAEADGVGDLTRRGYGWKMVGGAGSRFLQLQAHNGTTLSSVTSSFAVTAGVAFDWDIESDGAGNVTLYVNGASVATSNGGPTGSVNITAVAWQEEVVATAALSSPFMDFNNSRGRFIVINTW